MPAAPPRLSAVLGLPPKEALDFFRQKGFKIGFDHRDVWQSEHQAGFTVAKAMQLDLLRDIRAAVDDALANGTPFETFQQNLKPLLVQRGWWGRANMTDPLTGEVKEVQLGSPRRLKVIYDTNLRTAHTEGQWARIQDNKDALPFLMYAHTPSKWERPEHAAWDGLILPVDDPWWQAHRPIKAWGCKCRVIPMTQAQAARSGGPRTAPPDAMRDYVNKRTGETQRIPASVDPEFHYPPGGRLENLEKMLETKVAALPPDLRDAAQQLLPPRRPVWQPDEGFSIVDVGISDGFREAMRAGLKTIPPGVSQALSQGGYRVAGGLSLVNSVPRLASAGTPRGYKGSMAWHHVDGAAIWPEKIIAVGEYALMETGIYEAGSANRVANVLRHEHGHALDVLIGASASPAFMAAYAADVADLAVWLNGQRRPPTAVKDELRYIMQSGPAGRQEAFAELFAELYGGGTTSLIDVSQAMPRSFSAVRAIINPFEKGRP